MSRRTEDIPHQLLSWHEHVAFTRDKYPHLSYKEALSKASETYHKGAGKKRVVKKSPAKKRVGKGPIGSVVQTVGNTVGSVLGLLGLGEGGMSDPHVIAGLKKLLKKKKGGMLEDPHEIAGKKRRVVKKRAPAKKRAPVKKRVVKKRVVKKRVA